MIMDNLNQSSKLFISMFGELELTKEEITISEQMNRSRKLWNLLAYIITYRNKNITQSEFIDIMWGQSECNNPENALKNLLYRIRNLLEPIKFINRDIIITSNNSYRWNNILACDIDVDIFEENIKLASNTSLSTIIRINLYKEAISLYKGNFLSNHSKELWVIPLSTYYHNLYLDAVNSLALLYESKKMYDDMIALCNHAMQLDSCEERLHILLIQAYLHQGNNKSALHQYKVACVILYTNLGVRPSAELKNLYKRIMNIQKKLEIDLSKIQTELKECNENNGAFICEYGLFQEVYRLKSRLLERSDNLVFICLLTITTREGVIPTIDILNIAMKRLLQAISISLRKSDIVSKYSNAQYVIMIQTKSYDTCDSIMKRILNTYYNNNCSKHNVLHIKYNIDQIK